MNKYITDYCFIYVITLIYTYLLLSHSQINDNNDFIITILITLFFTISIIIIQNI